MWFLVSSKIWKRVALRVIWFCWLVKTMYWRFLTSTSSSRGGHMSKFSRACTYLIVVVTSELRLDGWADKTDTCDNSNKKIIRKLFCLGLSTDSFEFWPCLKYYMYTSNGCRQTNLLFPPRSYYQVVVVLVTLEWEKFGLRDPKTKTPPRRLLQSAWEYYDVCVYNFSFPTILWLLVFSQHKKR